MPKGATASTTTTRIISVFRKTSSFKLYSLIFISTTVATGLIFVISSLISFCFREDLFQYFKKLWLIGGEYRLELWNRLLDYIGDDIVSLWTYGSIIVLTVTYWFVGGIYTYLDVTNKPAALRRYKIQPGTNEPVDTKRVIQVIVNVTLNQTVVSFPISYVISNILVWRRTPPARDLPPAHQTAIHIILCILFLEAGIYYAHRLLHHRKLYKYFHKRHHEWTAPIAIVAFYSHPVEHVLTVLIPAYTGIIILNCHVFTAWVWFTLAITFSLSDHSGYHLPFFPSPEFHDYHHYKFNNCFGFLGILDRFHGTDAQFRNSMAYKRHKILKGFTPTRDLYPEMTNNNSKRKK